MDGAAHLVTEHVVDEPVLLDPRHPLEAIGLDLGTEVIAASGQVVDLRPRARNCLFDAGFQLVCSRHLRQRW